MPGSTVDTSQATQFLERRFGREMTNVARIGAGEWSTAYVFGLGERTFVIRFGLHREDFAKDRIAVEYRSAALPIPRVIEIDEEFGGWYAISERAAGGFLEELDADTFPRTVPALFDAIDAMRCADTTAHSGFGPWGETGNGEYSSWRDYLLDAGNDHPTQRTHGWRKELTAYPEAEVSFLANLTVLQDLVGVCPERRELIHNDLLNRNVLVQDHGITAIIDWGCSMYGDYAYDIALLNFWAPWFHGLRSFDILRAARDRFAVSDPASDTLDERFRAYGVHIGLVHIGYNAFLGREREQELKRVCERTETIAKG